MCSDGELTTPLKYPCTCSHILLTLTDDAGIFVVRAVVEPPVAMVALRESFLIAVAEDLVQVNELRLRTGKQRQSRKRPFKTCIV